MNDKEPDRVLTSAAFLLLTATLERHGNTLSGPHRSALHGLCATLTEFATRKLQGRKVFALATGLGKTSAIIAWLTVLARAPELTHVSVAVSASQVEALCSIKRALLANGVPEELIGLKHSLSAASLPSTGDDDRRFMLVTHQRIRGGTSRRLFCEHKGQPRSLLIYDESLFRSDTTAIGERDLRGAFGFALEWVAGKDGFAGVLSYLERGRDLIADAVANAKAAPYAAAEVALPELSEVERAGYSELLQNSVPGRKRDTIAPLLELVALSGCTLRVALTPQGDGILYHRIAVPAELENVLVLDASYPIRRLCQLDPTLSPASRFSDAPVKRFENVTVRQMFAHSGRNSIERSFKESKDKRAISREVVEVVKRIPADESALVFTFKSPDGRIKHTLLEDLRDAGVDVDATLADGTTKRISILTWGNETSLNEFSHCRHVILAGVLHRSLLDVASVAVGQLDDRKAKLEGRWLLDLVESEILHCIYQALSRGSCREVVDGQAKPMTAYVIHPRPLQRSLGAFMPGAAFKVWEPVYESTGDSSVVRLALRLLEHLKGVPESIRKVSSREVKKALGISPQQDKTFQRAVDRLDSLSAEWVREGRSLVRLVDSLGFGPTS